MIPFHENFLEEKTKMLKVKYSFNRKNKDLPKETKADLIESLKRVILDSSIQKGGIILTVDSVK